MALDNDGSAFLVWEETSMGFDTVLSETHGKKATMTSHAVEKGAEVTDHVNVEPDEVTLEVMITQHPISINNITGEQIFFLAGQALELKDFSPPIGLNPGSLFRAAGAAVTSLFGGAPPQYRAQVYTKVVWASDLDPMKQAQELLWGLIDSSTPVTVYTRTRIYHDMTLLEAPMSRTPERGESCVFSLQFKKMKIVSSGTAEVPKDPIAEKKKDKGMKNPKEGPTTKESVISDLTGYR